MGQIYQNNMENFDYRYDPNAERYIARLVKEWKEHGKIILAVDFDDTFDPWKFMDFQYEEVHKLIRMAEELGCYVVAFTACDVDRYDYIRQKYAEAKITLSAINENPIQLPYGNNRKIYYNHMLCDRAGLMQAMMILYIAIMRIKTEGKNGGEGFDV